MPLPPPPLTGPPRLTAPAPPHVRAVATRPGAPPRRAVRALLPLLCPPGPECRSTPRAHLPSRAPRPAAPAQPASRVVPPGPRRPCSSSCPTDQPGPPRPRPPYPSGLLFPPGPQCRLARCPCPTRRARPARAASRAGRVRLAWRVRPAPGVRPARRARCAPGSRCLLALLRPRPPGPLCARLAESVQSVVPAVPLGTRSARGVRSACRVRPGTPCPLGLLCPPGLRCRWFAVPARPVVSSLGLGVPGRDRACVVGTA